jgi:FAD dependent monooxygenase
MTFKVIIIGGSVSGLTMAHTLEKAGIEYVLLERGAEVTFNGGASIGLQPHGLRIMDQIGCYEDILGTTVPMAVANHRSPNGKAFSRSEFAVQIEERYEQAFNAGIRSIADSHHQTWISDIVL